MRKTHRRPAIGLLAAGLVLAASGCAAPSWARRPEARPNATIFSPLDLPAPNSVRTAAGAPGPDYWQQQVDYRMEALLDPETNTVAGRAIITYHNNSPDPLDYLWLHLEQNVFRADSIGAAIAERTAIGMRRSFGEGVMIHALRADGEDLAFAVYDTLARIELPAPLASGGATFAFEIEWSFVIPDRAFRRFGIEKVDQGTIYEIAQWFPAVAVYDDVHGWNTLPYLGTGEFYTNFGTYDVKLTVPRSHIVAATGVLQNPDEIFTPAQVERRAQARESAETVIIRGQDEVDDPAGRPAGEGPLTWHFRAEDVRTFAWASSDAFIYDGCGIDGVFVQSVYPKEGLPLWGKSSQMLRTAIEGYNQRWYPYPYPQATNVNGIEGGMEYPMIIFCRSRRSEQGLYGVTTHEIGHNWFPMLVSNDERRHAWMDEGFNSFINYYSYGEWFDGERGRRGRADRFAAKMLREDHVPIVTYPDRLPPDLLGELEYEKTAVGLVLLREQVLGPERFDYAFRTYIRRWAFKSPRPADFFRTMEDAAGADLAWFWRGWFYETAHLDQAVSKVLHRTPRRGRRYDIRIALDNLGALVMPVVLRLRYEDGSEETIRLPVEIWFNTDRFVHRLRRDARVVHVMIDPEFEFPDVRRSNNAWHPPL